MTDTEEEKQASKNYWLHGICILLGGLFIFAAIAKWADVYSFSTHVSDQFNITKGVSSIITRLLISLELTIGIALFIPFGRKRFSLPAAILLLILFLPYLIYLILTNDLDNCSCFGDWLPMGPVSSLIKTIALITIVCICYYYSEHQKRFSLIPLIIVLPILILVFMIKPISQHTPIVPKIDINDYQQLHPRILEYKRFSGREIDLSKELKLICFFNASCDHCVELAKKLNHFSSIPVYYILLGDEEQAEVFFIDAEHERPYFAEEDDERFFDISNTPPYIILSKDNFYITDWNYDSFSLDSLLKTLEKIHIK